MSASEVVHADILDESGHRFIAEIANLGSTGVFLKTDEPLVFGQRLSLRLFGVRVRGEVLFVASDPAGVVVGLRASAQALSTIEANRSQVEVLSGRAGEVDPWLEDTTTSIPPGVVHDDELGGAVVSVHDIESEGRTLAPAPPVPDDSADILEFTRTPVEVQVDPALLEALSAEERSLRAVSNARGNSEIGPPSVGLPPPTPRRASEVARPISALKPIPSVTSKEADDREALPILEADGYTVRFSSAGAYQWQFAHHINHGGLVVASTQTLPIRTQRMLSLVVPDVGTYTVSARVIFQGDGKLGFMLDSFGLHRERLAAMAKRS